MNAVLRCFNVFQDVAMVRAELVDAKGNFISPQDPTANTTVTFTIVSGGGRILATHNGSPDNVMDSVGGTFAASHGLVRAFVQSTEIHIGTAAQRALLKAITTDIGRNGTSNLVHSLGDGETVGDLLPIVVQASAPGLPSVTIDIPLSDSERLLSLAVAEGAL
jgi:hypothetical protein